MASPPLVLVFCGFPINGSQVSRRDGMSYYHRHHLEHHHHRHDHDDCRHHDHDDHDHRQVSGKCCRVMECCITRLQTFHSDTEAHIIRHRGTYFQTTRHISTGQMSHHAASFFEPTHIFYNQTQWIVSFEHQKEAQKINLYCFQTHKIGKAHQ